MTWQCTIAHLRLKLLAAEIKTRPLGRGGKIFRRRVRPHKMIYSSCWWWWFFQLILFTYCVACMCIVHWVLYKLCCLCVQCTDVLMTICRQRWSWNHFRGCVAMHPRLYFTDDCIALPEIDVVWSLLSSYLVGQSIAYSFISNSIRMFPKSDHLSQKKW